MRVALSERFQRDVGSLDAEMRADVFEVILALPTVLGDTDRHAGIGLRKLHARGIWEVRIGLGLRLVFGRQPDAIVLLRVGKHDDVRRYLRGL